MDFYVLLSWYIGFVIGSVLGITTDTFVLLWTTESSILFLILCFCIRLRKNLKILVLFFAGFLWGITHQAPAPKYALSDVSIAQKNLLPYGTGMLVKAKHENDFSYFFVTGSGDLQEKGYTKQTVSLSIFPPSSNSFHPHRKNPKLELNKTPKFLLHLKRNILKMSPQIQGLIHSVLLGDMHKMGSDVLSSFKRLGIYHLLVVSGLHVSFISVLTQKILSLPFRFIYALCLISPRLWFQLRILFLLGNGCLILSYANFLGFTASVQRAVLLFLFDQFVKIFCISVSRKERILSALVLQSCFFALDVLSVGSLLSWFSYLTVYAFAHGESTNWQKILHSQITLCLFIAGILGQMSVIGIFLNLLVVPIFPFIAMWLVPFLLDDFFHESFFAVGHTVQSCFLNAMRVFDLQVNAIPLMYFDIYDRLYLRSLCLCVSLLGLMILLRDIKKESAF